ncbi:NUDIX hydrolase [Micromonospora endophytica]|uniref:NUDIX hydrolase n=1 Tax=Micromonospora endophytica TaxID=515350 RepID=A0A2W2CHR0_9ACTN|nr:NUDIX domain-containing protein [Micromonospora endophytica]PZF97420.1 NUDIX hydrolase [Micromonospora endophytica]RIW45040.1 NUDIX domain-containing protein [Micromonospora endophytica]BCJ58001.1 putative hydrolase MutT/NUDIX [Micromonospora endophytica]
MVEGIRAAGGVVWRPVLDGGVQVCVVHRPRYGDWTLPKGKLEAGEHPLLAAAREVAEEADAQAVPQVRLPSVRYRSEGQLKTVDYWSMRAVGTGGFQPDTEVDDLRWLDVDDALALVSYPHDVEVLGAFAALPTVTTTMVLVRHGHAGKRLAWSGPDTGRPLDARGWSEAYALAPLIALIRPARLVSASPRRCVQTLDPAAATLDLPIEVSGDLDEPLAGQQPDECVLAAAGRLATLAAAGEAVAVCSQGKVIPGALERLAGRSGDFRTGKGGGWLLAFAGDRLLAADRL